MLCPIRWRDCYTLVGDKNITIILYLLLDGPSFDNEMRRKRKTSIKGDSSLANNEPIRPLEDMKKEFLSKLQRQNASLLASSSSLSEDFNIPDMTTLDPDLMGTFLIRCRYFLSRWRCLLLCDKYLNFPMLLSHSAHI